MCTFKILRIMFRVVAFNILSSSPNSTELLPRPKMRLLYFPTFMTVNMTPRTKKHAKNILMFVWVSIDKQGNNLRYWVCKVRRGDNNTEIRLSKH
jgi:hypothetical protein